MARAVYQYELNDADFTWLLQSFQENHSGYCFVETTSLPITFIKVDSPLVSESLSFEGAISPAIPTTTEDPDILSLLKGSDK